MSGDNKNYCRPLKCRTPHSTYQGEDEDSPDYDTSARLYFPTMEPKEEIPDVVWATKCSHKRGGMFVLIGEVKQQMYFEEGSFQSLKQILSKMHFQEACFGLFITPMQFRLRVAFKNCTGTANDLYFGSYVDEFAVGVNKERPFQDKVLGSLLDWLARIYLFGLKAHMSDY